MSVLRIKGTVQHRQHFCEDLNDSSRLLLVSQLPLAAAISTDSNSSLAVQHNFRRVLLAPSLNINIVHAEADAFTVSRSDVMHGSRGSGIYCLW